MVDPPIIPDWAAPVDVADPIAWDHPLNRGRIAWWLAVPDLTGGSRWPDLLGKFPGTLTSMAAAASGWRPTTRPGGWGHVLFDAVDDIVRGPAGNLLLPTSTPAATIAAWARPTSLAVEGRLVNFANASPASVFTLTAGRTVGRYSALGRTAAGGLVQVDSAASYAANDWHRVLATVVGTTMTLYVDGLPAGTGTVAVAQTFQVDATVLGIGSYPLTATAVWGGALDDVSVWGRALSAAEVAADHDLSRRGYPGVLNRWRPSVGFLMPAVGGGPVTLAGTGVPSSEAFGSGSLAAGPVALVGTGVPSSEALGAGTMAAGAGVLSGTGVAPSAALGAGTMAPGPVALGGTGVPSGAAFGGGVVAGAGIIAGIGIPAGSAFGAGSLVAGPVALVGTGIGPGTAFGVGSLAGASVIAGIGIPAGSAFGAGSLAPGPVTLAGIGLAPSGALGVGTILAAAGPPAGAVPVAEPAWFLLLGGAPVPLPPPPPPAPGFPTVPAAIAARVAATPALVALAGRVTTGLAPPGAETPYACLFPIAAPDEATTGTAYIRRWQYQATLFDDDPGRLAVLTEAWVQTFGRRSAPLATRDGRTFQVRSILGPTIDDARDQSLRGLPLWRQVVTVIVSQGRRWPA